MYTLPSKMRPPAFFLQKHHRTNFVTNLFDDERGRDKVNIRKKCNIIYILLFGIAVDYRTQCQQHIEKCAVTWYR